MRADCSTRQARAAILQNLCLSEVAGLPGNDKVAFCGHTGEGIEQIEDAFVGFDSPKKKKNFRAFGQS